MPRAWICRQSRLSHCTLCIRKKGHASFHAFNTVWSLRKQTVFPWFNQNVKCGTIWCRQHIINGRRSFLTKKKTSKATDKSSPTEVNNWPFRKNKGSNLTRCGGWAVNISNFARSVSPGSSLASHCFLKQENTIHIFLLHPGHYINGIGHHTAGANLWWTSIYRLHSNCLHCSNFRKQLVREHLLCRLHPCGPRGNWAVITFFTLTIAVLAFFLDLSWSRFSFLSFFFGFGSSVDYKETQRIRWCSTTSHA